MTRPIPAVEGSSRPGATARIKQRRRGRMARRSRAPPGCPPRAAPSAAEPPTTRLSMAKNAVRNVMNNATAVTQRHQRPTPPPAAPLRPRLRPGSAARSGSGTRRARIAKSSRGSANCGAPAPAGPPMPPPHSQPSADATRAIPRTASQATGDRRRTTARRPQGDDARPPSSGRRTPRRPKSSTPERATTSAQPRGGGVSAEDLLRREGRL